MDITESRKEKFEKSIANRQLDCAVILENVHDPHNLGAVLRTCDSVGIADVYILYTEDQLQEENIQAGMSSSSGASKWVRIHHFRDLDKAFSVIKKRYGRVLATHLGTSSVDLYDCDLTSSVAILLGNERDGLSHKALSYADANFIIPQMGMVQSLNISVACAVTLYELLRQRQLKNQYHNSFNNQSSAHQELFQHYLHQHRESRKPKSIQD